MDFHKKLKSKRKYTCKRIHVRERFLICTGLKQGKRKKSKTNK